MADRHHRSRLRKHRRKPPEIFKDAFGRTHKSEGDVTRPTQHRHTRRLSHIHAVITHHHRSRLRKRRHRKPKLP